MKDARTVRGAKKPTDAPAWVRITAWIGAVFYGVTGPWALASPRTFHDIVATLDPLNVHYLRDGRRVLLRPGRRTPARADRRSSRTRGCSPRSRRRISGS